MRNGTRRLRRRQPSERRRTVANATLPVVTPMHARGGRGGEGEGVEIRGRRRGGKQFAKQTGGWG